MTGARLSLKRGRPISAPAAWWFNIQPLRDCKDLDRCIILGSFLPSSSFSLSLSLSLSMSLSPASKLHMRTSTTSFPDIKLLLKNVTIYLTKRSQSRASQVWIVVKIATQESGKSIGKKAIRWLNLEETKEASARGRKEGSERASDAGVARTSPPPRRVRVTGVVSPGAWKYCL